MEMTTLFVTITGPGNAEDLENAGREVIARNGYQVGDFTIEQDHTDTEGKIIGSLEVEDRLWTSFQNDEVRELLWDNYSVEAF